MRRLLVLAAMAFVGACAHMNEHWGDDEDTSSSRNAAPPPPKEPAKSDSAAPPVSFVVSSTEDGEGTGDAMDRVRHDANAVKASEKTPEKVEKPAGESIPVIQEKKGKEIPVIIEKPQPEKLVLKADDGAKPTPKVVEVPKSKKGKEKSDTGKVAVADKRVTPEQQAYDPFQKLDHDMARIEGTPAKTEPPAPTQSVAAASSEEEATPAPPPPPKKKSNRDPNRIGLSILGGAGVLAAEQVIPGYGYNLAYGGQVAWNPAFMGDFAFDLGFWRSDRSSTTGFSTVASAQNHLSLRIMFLPTVVAGFYMGLGVGGVATYEQAHYRLGTAVPSELDAGSFKVGGDGTVALGYRIWHVEARIDLRVLYLLGNRLEFLPTGSIGATF